MTNTVIADALIPHERAIRKPLPAWASGLRDSFETWRLELTPGPSLTQAKALPPARAIMTACTERLSRCGLSMLLILARAVAVCASCGDGKQARQAAALGFERSREIEDVLLEIEFLKLMADAGAK